MYYNEDVRKVYERFHSSSKGISDKRAKIALAHHGYNELKQTKKISPWTIFLRQFKSFIIYILIAAFLISLILGFLHESPEEKFDSYVDAGVILAILVINAILGFVQEYRAEKSIEALKKLAGLKAKVIRNGKLKKIDAKDVVPGDVLVLDTGDKIPADSRLIEVTSLEVQESALTGESLPVQKNNKTIAEKAEVADRKNMVFSGTIITKGRGKAIVCGTGMKTEIGKIAKLIQEQEVEMTPLQQKLQRLGKWMGIMVLVIVAIVFIAGVIKGAGVENMFMAAVALAVAAVPEALPAVVTISLALGVQRMIGKNALVRKLPSVETLGSTTIICSDKTGTLTKNEMTVKKLYVNGKIVDVTGTGYDTKGDFSEDSKKFSLLLKCGALCNTAILTDTVIGDPTEGALIVSAAKAGLLKKKLEKENPKINELPFDSERKMMSTEHSEGKKRIMYTKGAAENVLKRCMSVLINGKVEKLTPKTREDILAHNKKFADSALRVLGFAYRELDGDVPVEKDLVFLGLQAMMDPPREEVKESIRKCKMAGIRVVMITGDHKDTAVAIAKELGIKGEAVTGAELEKEKDLHKRVDKIGVYARVNPEHKYKIVKALKKIGYVVAMTGDGVNDAPALKKADIGIAMGIAGTDVAKEASEMVLTDDNFSSIVNAIEEGRGIYDNIKHYVQYTLSSNLSEIFVIFLAIMFGWPLPLIAIHILWINLLTDGLPAVALVEDKVDKNIMDKKPRPKKEAIITRHNMVMMVGIAVLMTVIALVLFNKYNLAGDLKYARSVLLTAMIVLQMFNVLNATSETESVFQKGLFSNMYLILAILITIGLQAAILYIPWLTKIFKVMPLTLLDWVYIIAASSFVLLLGEIMKIVYRVRAKHAKEAE